MLGFFFLVFFAPFPNTKIYLQVPIWVVESNELFSWNCNICILPKTLKESHQGYWQPLMKGFIKLELQRINFKTIEATHLMTGLGATLLPLSPEEREVALVWRAILVAVLCLSEKPQDFFTGSPPTKPLKASVIAKACVQSIYILRRLYKTDVFLEKRDNQKRRARSQ